MAVLGQDSMVSASHVRSSDYASRAQFQVPHGIVDGPCPAIADVRDMVVCQRFAVHDT